MSVTINGSGAITFNDGSVQNTASLPGMRNRIINGAMMIDQRNAGASQTPTSDGQYNIDRWKVGLTQSSKFSVQQNAGSVTPPVGFTNYLGVTSLSAYSVLTGDTFLLQQNIEGFNVADLGFGTASASTVTLSFWVRSSLTGTFGGSLLNSGANRSYPFSYTISSANTWEQKSITIAGDTTGTWLTTNGVGLCVRLGLGSGSTFSGTSGAWATGNIVQPTSSVSVVGTNGATFYITGVQLEKGSTATSFDYRPYGTELALCQRYYQTIPNIWANAISGCSGTMPVNDVVTRINFYPPMRTTPTIVTFSENGTSGRISVNRTAAGFAANQLGADSTGVTLLNGSGSNFTSVSNVTFAWTANAEL